MGREVLEITRRVSSYPVLEQLVELGVALAGHRGSSHVSAFLKSLREELARRRRQPGMAGSQF